MPEAEEPPMSVSPPGSPLAGVVDKRPHLGHSGIMGRVGTFSPKSVNGVPTKDDSPKRPKTSGSAHGSEGSQRRGMTEKRLQKLLYLKQREEMKDALIHQVKMKYFETHPEARAKVKRKNIDGIITGKVEEFQAQNAKLSKENLERLLKRVDNETKTEDDKKSHMSEYSNLSQLSHASQAESVRAHVERLNAARGGAETSSPPEDSYEAEATGEGIPLTIEDLMGFNWVRLEEYKDRIAKDEDAVKAVAKEETKRNYTKYLDTQVKVRTERKAAEKDEDEMWRYVIEEDNERVAKEDAEKLKKLVAMGERQKRERDEAVALKHARIEVEQEQVRQEDVRLLAKVQREIEAAIKKEEKEKVEKKAVFLKVKNDIDAAKRHKEAEEAAAKAEEMRRARAYTKLLQQQEEEKKQLLAARNARQKELMEKMKQTVAKAAADRGAEDERRANAQRKEKEDLMTELEANKVEKLKKMREDTRDYVLLQMAEKNAKKIKHLEVKAAQGGILLEDAEAFYADKEAEKEKKVQKGQAYVKELRNQIQQRAARKVTNMTMEEVKLNKSLIDQVIDDELKRGILKLS
ncbi:unnamed protein product [Amoebophrya sp. A25]|nr:unnamed protein product [Amoebophrya sp. A25]|eukprot:GSA25T00015689001.1